jgi:hypothetical protein
MSIPDDNMHALSAFAAVAGEFCEFIGGIRDNRPERMYQTLETLLARLHLAILPVQIETPEKEHPEYKKLRIGTAEDTSLGKALAVTFGKECGALREWHGSFADDESRCDAERAGGLPDDLASIYADVRYGLALWTLGTPDAQVEAAWEWRWGYEHHWGDHLFRAITTIHEARYQAQAD